jgi:hypothetical protein
MTDLAPRTAARTDSGWSVEPLVAANAERTIAVCLPARAHIPGRSSTQSSLVPSLRRLAAGVTDQTDPKAQCFYVNGFPFTMENHDDGSSTTGQRRR